MKKIKKILVGLFLPVIFLTACSPKETKAVNIGVLKGPTGMSISGLIKNNSDNKYNFTIASTPDEIVPKIVNGELDIAAVPSNLASVLYNNTKGEIEVLNINTLGVLYIITSEELNSIEDLKGKTIYSSGKGATPEYVLNHILVMNNIDPENDVKIEFKSEHTEVVAALANDKTAVGLLPEPFATSVLVQNPNLVRNFDLTTEWSKVSTDSELIMGVVIARKDFIKNNPDFIKTFLEEYESSVVFTNFTPVESAKIIGENNIVPADIAEKAIINSSITYIDGDEMKTKLSGFLQILFDQNPKSIGGSMPNEDFYYKGK